jgi:hypothetical protein
MRSPFPVWTADWLPIIGILAMGFAVMVVFTAVDAAARCYSSVMNNPAFIKLLSAFCFSAWSMLSAV